MLDKPAEKDNKEIKECNKKEGAEELEYEKETEEKQIDFEKKINKLKEKLKACQEEKEQYLAGWQRERADFINYKRDEEERLKEIRLIQKGKVILEFLSILDSFEKAEEELKKIFQNKVVESENLSQWIKGILGIKNQIKNLLEKEGVKEIDTKRKFNPAFHEVVETVAGEDGQIMEVVQKGYLLEGEVLRFAKVKIGKKTENNNSMSSM